MRYSMGQKVYQRGANSKESGKDVGNLPLLRFVLITAAGSFLKLSSLVQAKNYPKCGSQMIQKCEKIQINGNVKIVCGKNKNYTFYEGKVFSSGRNYPKIG